MSTKKAPGPDGIGASVLRLLWEWDSARVMALVRASIRLGVHPKSWKVAKGITIPKPGKDDYSKVKSYRVISLLNCLEKVVEKVVAMMLSDHCKRKGTFHPGQYGSRRHRAAVDAVGVLMATAQEAWSRKKVVGALCMDVEAAFPSVSKECLARKMRVMKVDECLVHWMIDFMTDRSVEMVVDGQEGAAMPVNTSLPQGSPVSPILFAIYMADLHEEVEGKVQGCRSLSFVDDFTWIVEANNIPTLVKTLERCARISQRWAERNVVRFETSKTEAILLSRNTKHYRDRDTLAIQVGQHQIKFNNQATRWLGVWIDSALELTTHRQKCVARARAAEKQLR
jgi:hypothetical protein